MTQLLVCCYLKRIATIEIDLLIVSSNPSIKLVRLAKYWGGACFVSVKKHCLCLFFEQTIFVLANIWGEVMAPLSPQMSASD